MGAEVMGSERWTQILVESGTGIGFQLGALKNE